MPHVHYGEPELSENALRVLEARYLLRDRQGKFLETPDQLFLRVAKAVAQAELEWGGEEEAARWTEEFYQAMLALDFLPNSPTLMNAGTPIGQLSACFVLPVEDTMEDIFQALKNMALIQRTGGGTGFSFSRLRPRGDFVASTAGQASGPVSFMKIFDCATENIKQGGKRRGANMGILRVDHPDILEFIDAKRDGQVLRNFNISVGMTEVFFRALEKGGGYDLLHPRTGKKAGELQAEEVFSRIVQAAWQTGDPGLIFLDTINRANPTPNLGHMEATNPCGEIPLLPYESCNLGSINLSHMLKETDGAWEMDWEKLKSRVQMGIRFLDDVIEVNHYPLAEIRRMTKGNRKVGLGVMGLAEALIQLGIPYHSEEAVRWAEQVMARIQEESWEASSRLAAERGTFLNWEGSLWAGEGRPMRNATCNAIAPTGTISLIAETSEGIEPLFALVYRRSHVLGEQSLSVANPIFLKFLREHDLEHPGLLEEIFARGNLAGVSGIPKEVREIFSTALEIPVDQHLRIQAAFQKYVDNSVSKTINLPEGAGPEEIRRAYLTAWQLGLKGITVYRYGSKGTQVLELGASQEPMSLDYGRKCDPGECQIG